jgi:O-antigen/teichoic acid export membrane protein
VLYGPQWYQCIQLVEILALTAAVRSIGSSSGFLLLSQGRADLGFKWSFCCMLLQTVTIYFATYNSGLTGACVSLLVLQTIFSLLVYPLLIRPVIGPCFKEYISNILPATWATLIMTVAVYSFTSIFYNRITIFYLILLQIISGLIAYIPITWYLNRILINEIKSLSVLPSGKS